MAGSGEIHIAIDNTDKVMSELDRSITVALEMIGINAEKYAKALCPVGTPESTGKPGYRGGTLRNSITHVVEPSKHNVKIGTNVEYAPFVELGTVKMKPRPYLRPAIEDHLDEFKHIIEQEIKS